MSQADISVSLDGVTRVFRRGNLGQIEALKDVTLELQSGNAYMLVGPNGSGKTTLLRIILGLYSPTKGQVRTLGMDPYRQRDYIKQRTAYLPGFGRLYGRLTARENLEYFIKCGELSDPNLSKTIGELASKFKFEEVLNVPYATLSTGMRRRVEIACALSLSASLIVMDEPFSGLDASTCRALADYLEEISDEGKIIIIASHIMGALSALCAHVIELNKGKAQKFDGTDSFNLEQKSGNDQIPGSQSAEPFKSTFLSCCFSSFRSRNFIARRRAEVL